MLVSGAVVWIHKMAEETAGTHLVGRDSVTVLDQLSDFCQRQALPEMVEQQVEDQ